MKKIAKYRLMFLVISVLYWGTCEGADRLLGINFGGWFRYAENAHNFLYSAWGAVFGILGMKYVKIKKGGI